MLRDMLLVGSWFCRPDLREVYRIPQIKTCQYWEFTALFWATVLLDSLR